MMPANKAEWKITIHNDSMSLPSLLGRVGYVHSSLSASSSELMTDDQRKQAAKWSRQLASRLFFVGHRTLYWTKRHISFGFSLQGNWSMTFLTDMFLVIAFLVVCLATPVYMPLD